MFKVSRSKLALGAGLLALSAVLYVVQILVFGEPRSTFFYLLQDVAFLPISVLVVAIIVTEVIEWRERAALMPRLNMVIGVFFSELGSDLLRLMVMFDPAGQLLRQHADPTTTWGRAEFADAHRRIRAHAYACQVQLGDLDAVAALLHRDRDFLLALIQNPSLMEHELFTELLWAVLHIHDEIASRGVANGLDVADVQHLDQDIGRAYRLLVRQWLDYMEHLQQQYPYLYSLAVRTSPLAGIAAQAQPA